MDQARIKRLEKTFLEQEKESIQKFKDFQIELIKNNRLKTLKELSEKVFQELENEEEWINKMINLALHHIKWVTRL